MTSFGNARICRIEEGFSSKLTLKGFRAKKEAAKDAMLAYNLGWAMGVVKTLGADNVNAIPPCTIRVYVCAL